MNDIEYDICDTQGRIYEYAAKHHYNMKLFSDKYLTSGFCRRAMDAKYSRYQMADAEECMDFILPEIGPEDNLIWDDPRYFDPDVANWIGFTYRQMAFVTKLPSAEIVKRLSFDLMCAYYPGLHTVDEEMAGDIICQNRFSDLLPDAR